MNPELWLGLLGLLPLVLYIVLVFRNVDILTATAVCVVTGAVPSCDMRSMLKNGWIVAACQLTFLTVFSVFFA